MAGLTERRLVSLLSGRFAAESREVLLGIGDDAAVLSGAAEPWVVSVDASVEGVHFERGLLGCADIGYRAFQAAVSDLAAMGAAPVAALSSLVLPRALPARAVDELTSGQALASRELGCPIVGGNISRGGELSVTTTVIGRASEPLRRSGARPGDELWLIGSLGLAAAGLAALRLPRRRAAAEAKEARAEPLACCITAWRRPRALLGEGRALAGRASAAMDVSDGLSADAWQLARASGVRLVIDAAELRASLHPALLGAARLLRRSALSFAVIGGEDYALLATGPSHRRPASAAVIGRAVRGAGAFLDADGRLRPLGRGFDHLRR